MSALRVDRHGGVAELVLARPDRRNALDYAAVGELLDALRELDADDDVGSVLLRGEGRSFCAGGDLAEFTAERDATAAEFHQRGQPWADLMLVIPAMRTPVIAAPHGHALAGGCGLVAAADIAIAAEGTAFGTSEITIGLFPIIVYPTLARAVGARRARELALTGRRVDAAEAAAIGLVHTVIAADRHLDEARRVAATVASFGPEALALGKWLMRTVDDLPIEQATELARAARGSFMSTADFAEGVTAFLDKRQPRFR